MRRTLRCGTYTHPPAGCGSPALLAARNTPWNGGKARPIHIHNTTYHIPHPQTQSHFLGRPFATCRTPAGMIFPSVGQPTQGGFGQLSPSCHRKGIPWAGQPAPAAGQRRAGAGAASQRRRGRGRTGRTRGAAGRGRPRGWGLRERCGAWRRSLASQERQTRRSRESHHFRHNQKT